MPLDRQSIEKRDFPIGRRGYEPDAVDAHLAELAEEVAELKSEQQPRSSGGGSASLASAASDQVRLIVQAAESSAAEIEKQARDEAATIRGQAAGDAERTSREAVEKSREHVGRVHDASTTMLQRVDAMESELTALMESLRTGANRLNADLTLLQGNMGELYEAAGGEQEPAPAAVTAVTPAATADVEVEVFEEDEASVPVPPPAAEADPAPAAADEPADDDSEGARLVALDMALSGKPRTETEQYLSEHYDLEDRDSLLDEVYATVE